jgi:hypothetical protein
LRAPGKVKHKKKDHWDNARARFAALKVLDSGSLECQLTAALSLDALKVQGLDS